MKNFILATRPKTLLAGFIPPLVSFVYFSAQSFERPYFLLFCCLISATCIQIATNFFNDVIDFKKGADQTRKGPMRVTASGRVKPKTITFWAIGASMIAIVAGYPLIVRGGLPILILGLISVYLSYGYTGGPLPLAYKGLGELFVFLFFGLFSVVGSYYLYAQRIDPSSIILACIYGLLTTTFICINNLRDREEDAKVGKRTLATRISVKSYQALTLITIFAPYFLLHFFKQQSGIYLTFLALLPATKLAHITLTSKDEALNVGLKFSGIHMIVFSLFFILSIKYENIFP